MIFNWVKQFETGIETVDSQHKVLVQMINKLSQLLADHSGHAQIKALLKELVDYTHYHFSTEETLMQEQHYASGLYAQHRDEHQKFIGQIHDALTAYQEKKILSDDLLDFLVEWLRNHILVSDKLMAQTLKEQEARLSIDALNKTADQALNSQLFWALRESDQRFRELAEHLPALVWLSDASNFRNYSNPYWMKLCGVASLEKASEQWQNFIHPEDRQAILDAYSKILASKTKQVLEYRVVTPDNKILWILETAIPRMQKNGELLGLMGCGMNITKQKKAAAVLLQAKQQLETQVTKRTQELLSANHQLQQEKAEQLALNQKLQSTQAQLLRAENMASIGQLAAGVAHEINNPLGYIYSNLTTLKKYWSNVSRLDQFTERIMVELGLDHPLSQQVLNLKQDLDWEFTKQDLPDLLEECLEGAQRAKKIIQDLLDFSASGQLSMSQLNLEDSLDEVLNSLNLSHYSEVTVIREYADIEPISAAKTQIHQLFRNLLLNALEAIDHKGSIHLRTGYMNKTMVWIEIEDNGGGIDERIRARVFNPFFTTKAVGKGTGLGLSLVDRIVRDHQGEIEFRSESGKGTIFRVILPIHTHNETAELLH